MTPRAAAKSATQSAGKSAGQTPGKSAVKAVSAKPAAKPDGSKSVGLDQVFDDLKAILSRYAKGFSVREGAVKNKRDYHLILKKPLVIAGRKKDELWFASVIQQKNNVGFYYMPSYCVPDIEAKLSTDLVSHLDGKCCFHFKVLTPQLKKDIDAALKIGFAAYKKQGWM